MTKLLEQRNNNEHFTEEDNLLIDKETILLEKDFDEQEKHEARLKFVKHKMILLKIMRAFRGRIDGNNIDDTKRYLKLPFDLAIISGIKDTDIFEDNEDYCNAVIEFLECNNYEFVEVGELSIIKTKPIFDMYLAKKAPFFNERCFLVIDSPFATPVRLKRDCMKLAVNFNSHFIFQDYSDYNAQLMSFSGDRASALYSYYDFEITFNFFNEDVHNIKMYFGDDWQDFHVQFECILDTVNLWKK